MTEYHRWNWTPGKPCLLEQPPNFIGPYCQTCALKWPRCLCISESDWEDVAMQQMPKPAPLNQMIAKEIWKN